MIRCSGFLVAMDGETAAKAEAGARLVDRRNDGTVVFDAGGGAAKVVALSIGGGAGLPAVHGWRGDGAEECSEVSMQEGELVASRDVAGTRPLFVSRSRRWVASDWRFIRGEPCELLPPGARYGVGSGQTARTAPPGEEPSSFEEAARRLSELIDQAVKARVVEASRVAVAFSGGVDSAMLACCAKKHAKVLCCTVSSPGSRDGRNAPGAADALGVELMEVPADASRARRELAAMELPFDPSPMDRSLWCVYSLAAGAAAGAGADVMLLGQLADELFGGYAKYERAGECRAGPMMEADVMACGMRGLPRDEAACARWLEPRFPFADRRIVSCALSLPVAFKVAPGARKRVLREAAVLLGVPEEIAFAPKKAAQYSSGMLKLAT